MIHTYTIDGLPVRTGDLLCTIDGAEATVAGQLWRLIGSLMPGEVDHVALYLGPGPQVLEAGPLGVQVFELPGERWESQPLKEQRGFLDTLYGVAEPVAALSLPAHEQDRLRLAVVDYCLAQLGKPYNMNFFDIETEDAFYCSQLAYRAYLRQGIDLRQGRDLLDLGSIVLPKHLWRGSTVRRRVGEPKA